MDKIIEHGIFNVVFDGVPILLERIIFPTLINIQKGETIIITRNMRGEITSIEKGVEEEEDGHTI